MSMKTWNNGDSGKIVKAVIDYNFNILDNRISEITPHPYTKVFTTSDWSGGEISIPYSEHNIINPVVAGLYILVANSYEAVFSGYRINGNTVVLQSDIPYNGKVVIE